MSRSSQRRPLAHLTARLSVLPFAALVFVSGCTFSDITPSTVNKPSQSYTEIALGEVKAPDEATGTYVASFRRGFDERVKSLKGVDTVLDPAPVPLPPTAVAVTGRITEVDKGNAALRLLIGFGAGRSQVTGEFSIRDTTGTELAHFESAESYGGGVGLGGVDFVDMDDLTEKLGAQTADIVWRWSKGQDLNGPEPETK